MKTILYFSLITIHCSLFAQQNKIDSLRNVLQTEKEDTGKAASLNRLSTMLWRAGQLDTAMVYANKSQILSEKLAYKKGLADAFKNRGIIYDMQGNYSKALENDFKALAIAQESGSKNDAAKILGNIGFAYDHEGDYPKALEYDFKSLSIQQEVGNKSGIAPNFCNIGIIYLDQKNFSLALEYEQKSLAVNMEAGSKSGSSFNLSIIGAVYSDQVGYTQKNQDSLCRMALIYYHKALALDIEIGYKRGIAANTGNIGGVFEAQARMAKLRHEYDESEVLDKEALEYDFKALVMDKEMGNKEGIANRYDNIGSEYVQIKKYPLAKAYLDSALTLAKEIGEKEYAESAYNNLTIYDSTTGNYKQALEDYKNSIIYRDSLMNEANTKKTVQAEMNFEFEQKQASEKAEQDKKDAVAEQERNKQVVIRNSFMAGFALMLALAFFIFRGYRQKQKANSVISNQKAMVEQKQKEILDSIHYAQRIQKALLASDALLSKNLPEYFVMYKPKDIVSGDFYWATKKGEAFYLSVCDSTGHGVPGAFMSLLNISFLNEAITEKNITQPNEVFNHARKRLIENVSQDGGQDGMDGVLMAISPVRTGTGGHQPLAVSYSAAYNSPVVIRDGKIIELPADKMPVGSSPKNDVLFTAQSFNLQKGDTLYLFTDGYADQFGGAKAKKFMHRKFLEKLLAISDQPLAEQKDMLEKEFETWKGGLEQVDDVLVIGIRV